MSPVTAECPPRSTLLSLFPWSTTPPIPLRTERSNDAQSFASSVNGLSNSLSGKSQQLDTQIGSTVSQINSIAAQVQQYNQQELRTASTIPARRRTCMPLSIIFQLTNFSTVKQSDGTISVMLGGGYGLVMGTQVNPLSAPISVTPIPRRLSEFPADRQHPGFPGQRRHLAIHQRPTWGNARHAQSRAWTLLGNGQQQGTFNQFAQTLADTVNQILQSGTVSTASGAAAGRPSSLTIRPTPPAWRPPWC